MQRRKFIHQTGLVVAGVGILGHSCAAKSDQKNNANAKSMEQDQQREEAKPNDLLKISLAQWSLHRTLNDGKMTNLDFARVTKETYGIDGIEYVSRFFKDNEKDKAYLDQLNTLASDHEVTQLLIMVDGEGGLAEVDDKTRQQSIENHYKWVEAAKHLGCHSIRVNAYSSKGSREEMHAAAVDGLGRLAAFAKPYDINVIVENHGGLSSDGSWLAGVMKEINMDTCGTLPDFGNFCITREEGNWRNCLEEYDRYKGMKELMPYAKAVSAKSNVFNAQGDEVETDFKRVMDIVKAAGYTNGWVGIEYEGSDLSEHDGIIATKKLLERVM